MGTLLKSRSSIVCPQTTHFAILLSVLGRRESVTEYIAPQWGQKKVPPSGTGPNRGTSAPPIPRTNMRPKGNIFQRRRPPIQNSLPRHRAHDHRTHASGTLADVALCAKEPNPLSTSLQRAIQSLPRRVNKHSTYVEAPRCSRSCGSSIQSPASPSPLVQRRSPRVRSLERGEYAPRHPRDVRYGALGAVAIGVGLTVGSSNLEPVHYHRPFMNSAISRLKREASSQNGE